VLRKLQRKEGGWKGNGNGDGDGYRNANANGEI
jgi:hypothetical protein